MADAARFPTTDGQRFRRNLGLVTGVHLLGVALFFFASKAPPRQPPQVMWLDGGTLSAGGVPPESDQAPAADPLMSAEPQDDAPLPEPAPIEEASLIEVAPVAPSEIVLPKATPSPTTPKPTTPRPATPRAVTPKPVTPKPDSSRTTSKATAKATPRTTPKSSPKPTASPKPTPVAPTVAKANAQEAGSAKSTPAESTKASSGATDTSKSAVKTAGSNGAAGSGHGPGRTGGGGASTNEFSWYYQMLQDRFESRWQQPTSVVRSSQEFVTTLKIRIGKSGDILAREIVNSSGNAIMDESVRGAAEKVQSVDPLPAGLGSETFDVNINFKLDQGE